MITSKKHAAMCVCVSPEYFSRKNADEEAEESEYT